jgi:hypothetical protein
MDTSSVGYLEALLLRKLARRRNWGESHTAFDEWVKRALPTQLQGAAKKVGEELIKENFVLKKPASYGLQVSLNPKKADEIKQKIENV